MPEKQRNRNIHMHNDVKATMDLRVAHHHHQNQQKTRSAPLAQYFAIRELLHILSEFNVQYINNLRIINTTCNFPNAH